MTVLLVQCNRCKSWHFVVCIICSNNAVLMNNSRDLLTRLRISSFLSLTIQCVLKILRKSHISKGSNMLIKVANIHSFTPERRIDQKSDAQVFKSIHSFYGSCFKCYGWVVKHIQVSEDNNWNMLCFLTLLTSCWMACMLSAINRIVGIANI